MENQRALVDCFSGLEDVFGAGTWRGRLAFAKQGIVPWIGQRRLTASLEKFVTTGAIITTAHQPGEIIDAYRYDILRLRERGLRHASQRYLHEIDPDGLSGTGTILITGDGATQLTPMVIKADPGGCYQFAVETGEPGILGLVGGPGFAGDICAAKLLGCSPAGTHPTGVHTPVTATEDGAMQRFGNKKRIGMADDLRRYVGSNIQRQGVLFAAGLGATGGTAFRCGGGS